ncbi:MAG: copper resistance protein CopC [Actinobacteria bacterium]|nr:copper resistance protein CopC [Actinomycetota bacterium]
MVGQDSGAAVRHYDRGVIRRALAVLPVLLAGLALAGAAHGHAGAATLSPAADQRLAGPPPMIRIVFSERVSGGPTALRLVDAAGRSRAGAARITGRELTAQVTGTLGPGRYAYAYAVTGTDGHVIRRAVPFAVKVATPAAAATTVTLAGQRLRLSGARVGVRTLALWGGLEDGTAEWRHPLLDAPFAWTFVAGRASGMLPFPGTYRLTVRALVDGFSERTVSGTVTIAG